MSDWTKPKTTDLYTDWETELKGRRDEQATLFKDVVPASLPAGAVRFNRALARFEEWDGVAWQSLTVESDRLQGKVPADFVPVDGSAGMQGDLNLNGNVLKTGDAGATDVDHIWHDDTTNTWHFCSDSARQTTGNSTLQAGTVKASSSMQVGANQVWHAGNDGAGSGLDADTLDGNQASAFAAATHSHTEYAPKASPTFSSDIRINDANTKITEGLGNAARVQTNSGYLDMGPQDTSYCHLNTDRSQFYLNKELLVNGNQVWHAGNDSAGSGLDADLLDGNHASAFALSGHTHIHACRLGMNSGVSTSPINYTSGGFGDAYVDYAAYYKYNDNGG